VADLGFGKGGCPIHQKGGPEGTGGGKAPDVRAEGPRRPGVWGHPP